MRIHLVTVVGGHIEMLPVMLEHYRELGVESFVVNVHLRTPDDPAIASVQQVTDHFGCDIATVVVGDWQTLLQHTWQSSMQMHADDWCILADQDELQQYPDGVTSLLDYCERRGYDYVTGAMVDRISADGRFPAVSTAEPVWSRFPLGGFLTSALLGGDPRKVVAARGRVPVSPGKHYALDGVKCPVQDAFLQVHHFKWTAGLVDRLKGRTTEFRRLKVHHWRESERFVQYFESHDGRIDLDDPRFMIAPCSPAYPHWDPTTLMTGAAAFMQRRGITWAGSA